MKEKNVSTYQRINVSTYNKGQTLVEVIVALGIIIMVLTSALVLASSSIKIGTKSKQRTKALGYAQQGIEAVRNIRDSNLLSKKEFNKGIEAGEEKKVKLAGKSWELKNGSETIGDFERKIRIERPDDDTIKVKVTVNWNDNKSKVELTSYLTNWKK